jgi:hypothetical protein
MITPLSSLLCPMPWQAVHDLILAQPGGLGDFHGRVFAQHSGRSDAVSRSTVQQRLEFSQDYGLIDLGAVIVFLRIKDQASRHRVADL